MTTKKQVDWVLELFLKIPRVSNVKGEHLECVNFAKELQALTIKKEFKAVWTHVQNEFAGKKRPVWGSLMKAMGKVSGMSDYFFMWDGGNLLLEMKIPGGRMSDNQKAVKAWADEMNVPYEVAWSTEEAFDILQKYGLL
jgi:hypothetical protein